MGITPCLEVSAKTSITDELSFLKLGSGITPCLEVSAKTSITDELSFLKLGSGITLCLEVSAKSSITDELSFLKLGSVFVGSSGVVSNFSLKTPTIAHKNRRLE